MFGPTCSSRVTTGPTIDSLDEEPRDPSAPGVSHKHTASHSLPRLWERGVRRPCGDYAATLYSPETSAGHRCQPLTAKASPVKSAGVVLTVVA